MNGHFLLAALQVAAAQPAVAPAQAQASPPVPALYLVCHGVGDRTVTHTSFGSIFGKHGAYASGVGTSQEQEQFGEQMDVDLTSGAARARVPRRFLPPLHGGEEGWFGLKDLVITDDAITGMVLINAVNHPKMRIDRRTGNIALDGKVGAYAGECQPYDPATSKRAF